MHLARALLLCPSTRLALLLTLSLHLLEVARAESGNAKEGTEKEEDFPISCKWFNSVAPKANARPSAKFPAPCCKWLTDGEGLVPQGPSVFFPETSEK